MSDALKNPLETDKLEIVKTGVLTTTPVSATSPGAGNYRLGFQSDSINHNLGYVPIVFAFVEIDGAYTRIPHFSFLGDTTNPVWFLLRVFTDTTDMYVTTHSLRLGAAYTGEAYTVRYYLLRQPANIQ